MCLFFPEQKLTMVRNLILIIFFLSPLKFSSQRSRSTNWTSFVNGKNSYEMRNNSTKLSVMPTTDCFPCPAALFRAYYELSMTLPVVLPGCKRNEEGINNY